jgi:hypothetical protein
VPIRKIVIPVTIEKILFVGISHTLNKAVAGPINIISKRGA